jgi:hypothetical protein
MQYEKPPSGRFSPGGSGVREKSRFFDGPEGHQIAATDSMYNTSTLTRFRWGVVAVTTQETNHGRAPQHADERTASVARG